MNKFLFVLHVILAGIAVVLLWADAHFNLSGRMFAWDGILLTFNVVFALARYFEMKREAV